MDRTHRIAVSCAVCLFAVSAFAEAPLLIAPLIEKRVEQLPDGTLFWRIENFATLSDATAGASPTSLAVEAAGKVWLFTLGPRGGRSPNAVEVAEVGPIPRVSAKTWLLRINDASGPPGSVTPIHSHPGSEAFYVLEGRQGIRGAHGTMTVEAGMAEAGHGADQAMQVSSSGPTALHALVMFVVDADRPFSSPATLP